MSNQTNSINSYESIKHQSKYNKFIENSKKAVRDVLVKTGIVASTMGPMATTATSTVVPASANTITQIEPTTFTSINAVGLGTTENLFAAFNEKDNKISDTETPTNNYTETAFDTELSETDATTGENESTAEAKSSINSLEYKAIEITNINPEDLMPKVEVGDKNVYKHIEHLRIPESTVVTDMMREYGAGKYSAEEYQQLMMRLNTGMMGENPVGYDNYEAVGGTPIDKPSNHAHAERFILNTLIKHANFKVINSFGDHYKSLYNLCKENPNNINIMGISIDSDVDRNQYESRNIEEIKEYDKEKNRLIFCAGGNIGTEDGNLHNKVYQENLSLPDKHSVYSSVSRAHNKNDNVLNRHLMITFGTNKNGDINQTSETSESSKFPVGFHDNVLFSGRTFPRRRYDGDKIRGDTGKYATSQTNFVNVAVASILFQMKADTPDVDEFLKMVRATALTDYIRFDLNGDGDTNDNYNGQPETQELQLMNPAGFFQKYLMPTSLPTKIKTNETTPIEKGYYHGIVYQIPGAEVNINGQWIPFTDDNKELILSQNPMNLEWRLNGELLNNYNYKPGDTINGQIIVVDDKRNGLNITKDFSVNIEDASGIDSVTMNYIPNAWYTIDGIRLDKKPTKPGIYIMNGQKIIIK